MMYILWLSLTVGYGLFIWAAEKRNFAGAALCFFDGGYLAFLCFALLPCVMGTEMFFRAAALSGLGVFLGVRLEGRKVCRLLVFSLVTGSYFLWQRVFSLQEMLLLSCFGGMGLYHASAGIIPDEPDVEKGLLSGAGFLIGTFLFVGV